MARAWTDFVDNRRPLFRYFEGLGPAGSASRDFTPMSSPGAPALKRPTIASLGLPAAAANPRGRTTTIGPICRSWSTREKKSSPAAVILPDCAHRTQEATALRVTSHNGTTHATVPRWSCVAGWRGPWSMGRPRMRMGHRRLAWTILRSQDRADICATAVPQPQGYERSPSPVVPQPKVPVGKLLPASRKARTGPARLRPWSWECGLT